VVPSSFGIPSDTSSKANEGEKKVLFHFKPKLGLNYNQNKTDGIWSNNLQWMVTINSDLNYRMPKFDLGSYLFLQYGESKITGQSTQKLKDVLILSVTPSIPLIKTPAIRLFLETTGETAMTDGTMQNNPSEFLEPLFLYQSLFVGQKKYSNQNNEKTTWGITYGIGYALQQTINNPNDIHHTMKDFESGFSGIADFNINSQVTKNISFSLNTKAITLSNGNPFRDLNNARRSLLLQTGIFYKKIGVEFVSHIIHDPNLSTDNQIDRSLMLTIRF